MSFCCFSCHYVARNMNKKRDFQQNFNRVQEDLPLSVLFSGRESCEPGHRFGGERTHFVIHYVLAGNGTVRTYSEGGTLSKGDIFLLFPGVRNRYRADYRTPWTYGWIGFSGTHAAAILNAHGITAETCIIHGEFSVELAGYFFAVLDILKADFPVPFKSEGYLYLVLSSIAERLRPARREPSGKWDHVHEAIRFIETNFGERINVNDVTDHVGLERAYFSTLFSSTTGNSLLDYLTTTRLEKSKILLQRTDYTVGDVAASVGYSNYATFARRFKDRFGITPGSYRDGILRITE